ncbi:T9SS type A sorting domain-containing protein [Chitinophaga tropicalis]|uniref:Secretion system C-terminal sorting domain-containing protein n=1 Tax=Chitinophaga tropicalis TaxID=2683588 RepID=A0A7K1UAA1_9BACT|nr:hypothetical protein [Chitinophaga tropicalis]MVT11292.1 hypothetical protein [Chitinophaga tropicalis]
MNKLKTFISAGLLCASVTGAQAQGVTEIITDRYVISVTGYSRVTDEGFQIDWSVGEPIVETISAGKWVLTQGYQQPRNGRVVSETSEVDPMIIYPNPANNTDNVTIEYTPADTTEQRLITQFDVKIMNYIGQVVYTDTKTVEPETPVIMYTIPSGKLSRSFYLVSLILNTGVTITRKLLRVDY